MASKPSLTDMPKLVLENILEYSGIRSILVLRKVCRNLRNFIDDVKPEGNLTRLKVSSEDSMKFFVDLNFIGGKLEIEYHNDVGGCRIVIDRNSKFLKSQNFLEIFHQDFSIIIRHIGLLDELLLRIEPQDQQFLNSMEHHLKSRPRPLRVKELDIGGNDQKEVLQILPYLDPKFLKIIVISIVDGIDEIVKLEQWKNADDVEVGNCVDPVCIKDSTHFRRAHMRFTNILPEHVMVLKEALLRSSKFQKFQLHCHQLNHISQIWESLGPAYRDMTIEPHKRTPNWYFRIPSTTNEVMHVEHEVNNIEFSRIDASSVPEEAVIQN